MSVLRELIPKLDRGFDALEAGDLDAFMELVRDETHPQCEFRSGIGSAVGGGVYTGLDGIRTWFGDLVASSAQRHWRRRSYETHGDQLLVFLADFELAGAASQVPVSSETGAVFEFQNGLCVRITSFMSRAEARELAEARVA